MDELPTSHLPMQQTTRCFTDADRISNLFGGKTICANRRQLDPRFTEQAPIVGWTTGRIDIEAETA